MPSDERPGEPLSLRLTGAPVKVRVAVAALLLAIALAAAGSSLAVAESASTGTEVTAYNPVSASGTLASTPRVTARLHGH